MAEVGIKEVTLIGGEAFMRPDWLQIAEAINQAGMLCSMTTGGYGISLETARRMKEAGGACHFCDEYLYSTISLLTN
jgi:MoaA/NifB/PqqE/SkfB family radical SAM enzyme